MTVRIRAATAADLPRLVALFSELSLDDPREDPDLMHRYSEAFEAIEARPGYHVLAAEEDGELLASVTVIVEPNLTYQGTPFALIENVIVTEAARGKGVGTQIINAAVEIAREAGCYKVSLTSNKRREDAHRFYESIGFQPSHEGFQLRL
jgi:GNAT superfamily N-acetyltransferase